MTPSSDAAEVAAAEKLADEYGVPVYYVLKYSSGWDEQKIVTWFTAHPSANEAADGLAEFQRGDRGYEKQLARMLADEGGENYYLILEESFGWSREWIQDANRDSNDAEYREWLDDDVGCTDDELGMNDEGEFDDS